MDGFQYTNTNLDFFPHSEGYIKAVMSGNLGGTPSYEFRYVFNFTDHLGNIRLKYAQDPSNNNAVTILEEDHYYPYGLKHKGYSGNHLVFEGVEEPEGPGTGITLTPVNPFLGDSYKYKFDGKEYQGEFNINSYDFGARNYDPALGRWMNIDPLTEFMWSKSPYVYAFDNPIYYIDPDGMMPFSLGGGSSMGLMDINNGNFGSEGLKESVAGIQGPGEGDTINPNNPEVLDEVNLGVVKKKEHPLMGNDNSGRGNIFSWGNGTEDNGRQGKANGELNLSDLPIPMGSKTGNSIMDFLKDLLELLDWDDRTQKALKSNQSTMENRNKEPVAPPKNNIEYTVEGQLKPNSRYGINNPDYGGIGESSSTKDYNKAKGDSLRFSKTSFFNKISIRRDTIK